MPVYTVHAPVNGGADFRATDKFAFVRDGFHFWAFLFGPLWLLWHRLWLATIGWIVLVIALDAGLIRLGSGRMAIGLASLVVALLLGFEAASARRWTLARNRYRQIDVVVADDEEMAERRFFDRWAARQGGVSFDPTSVDRGGPPPVRSAPSPPPLPGSGIIGLFPEPGSGR
jgi:hypothetical protein